MPKLPALPADQTTIRLVIVTNIPAPYRVPVYNRIAATPGISFRALYAASSEPDRRWDLPPFEHEHVFLTGAVYERSGRYIHYNPDVWDALREFKPDVVITTGYNPTHILAFLYAKLHGVQHVVMTDGTDMSEARLGWLHRWTRRAVFAGSRSFVAASLGGWRLLRSYNVRDKRIHFSPLCANTSVSWDNTGATPADIDLLFSGRLVEIKNASFALETAQGLARKLGRRVSIALLGSGPQEPRLRKQAAAMVRDVDVHFAGHVAQTDLPRWFLRARLFVFPTLWDPWGVVANEACLAGVPVLVSPHAGAAGELVVDGVNGRILPLELQPWIDAAAAILQDSALHAKLAAGARLSVQPYSFDNATFGIVDAVRQSMTPADQEAPPRLNRYRRRRRVVCVQRRLPHYREPLFEALRQSLAQSDVDFVLVHGQPTEDEMSKNDAGYLSWALHASNRYWLGGKLCWQDPSVAVAGADLVIVPQENRLLYNLIALATRPVPRLAFWGHGRNFQSNKPDGWRERFKARTLRYVDWWFAYTGISTQYLVGHGFPAERVTTLNNSIDTAGLMEQCASVQAAEVQALRQELRLGDGPVGLFVGSLYPDKRLGFLLDAAALIVAAVPGFHLVVVGDGPDRARVERAALVQPWVRYAGVRLGRDKAVCLCCADLLLNPGLLGLGILDAFAAGLPVISTDCRLHSPEVAYLRHDENGLMTADSVQAFVDACVRLLRDEVQRKRLAAQAAADAERYTLAHMINNFRDGIVAALQIPANR